MTSHVSFFYFNFILWTVNQGTGKTSSPNSIGFSLSLLLDQISLCLCLSKTQPVTLPGNQKSREESSKQDKNIVSVTALPLILFDSVVLGVFTSAHVLCPVAGRQKGPTGERQHHRLWDLTAQAAEGETDAEGDGWIYEREVDQISQHSFSLCIPHYHYFINKLFYRNKWMPHHELRPNSLLFCHTTMWYLEDVSDG